MNISLFIEVETQIDGDIDYIDVELEGIPKWENGSFDYEFGTEKIPNYLSMEDSEITWDESMHTIEQNVFINMFLNKYILFNSV